jgi:hypothetical protein
MTEFSRKRTLSISTEPDTDEVKRPRLTASLSYISTMTESFASDYTMVSPLTRFLSRSLSHPPFPSK